MRLPGSAMIPICQGADVVFQKSVHACINLPLNHMVAHPVQLCPLPVRCSGDPYPLSLARRVELSPFWLPLTGYARQHPERQEWRAVPALYSRKIYVIFVEGGWWTG